MTMGLTYFYDVIVYVTQAHGIEYLIYMYVSRKWQGKLYVVSYFNNKALYLDNYPRMFSFAVDH